MSTQRSSMSGAHHFAQQPGYMSASLFNQQVQLSQDNSVNQKYRTDSATKPFSLKKPAQDRANSFALPSINDNLRQNGYGYRNNFSAISSNNYATAPMNYDQN